MSAARDTVAGLSVRRNSDATLLGRALRGDAVAFSEVHRRYNGRVFAFCLARLMSVDAAQDATQEVFLRLLAADPDQVRSISGWLFGVARHVCIDISRSRQRAVPTASEAIEGELGARATGLSAEDQALSQAEADDVFLALRRMKPRYRTVLVLRELHGQSMSEIAEALSVNMGAAYTLLSRARDSFGKAYAGTHELPGQCREAVELLYRETGSGISEVQSERLHAHLAQCSDCSREARNAKDRPLFAGLLPLLPMSWSTSRGLLARALSRLGRAAPSLGTVAPAAPAVAPWAPVVVATAFTAAVVLGAVAVPAGLQTRSNAANAGSATTPAPVSSSAVSSVQGGYQHSESSELRAQLLVQRQGRLGEQSPTAGGESQSGGGRSESGGSGTRAHGTTTRSQSPEGEATVRRGQSESGSGGSRTQVRGTTTESQSPAHATTTGSQSPEGEATVRRGQSEDGAAGGSSGSDTAKPSVDPGPSESAGKEPASGDASGGEVSGEPAGGSAKTETPRAGAGPR